MAERRQAETHMDENQDGGAIRRIKWNMRGEGGDEKTWTAGELEGTGGMKWRGEKERKNERTLL